MIIKVIFNKPKNNIIPIVNQKELNSYIHKCLGINNEYHDSFSDYAISSIQGGKLNNNNMLSFENSVPYIIISSENFQFISQIIMGIESNKFNLFDMTFKNFEFNDFKVNQTFDKIITISPILLKKNNKKITFTDKEWVNVLIEQTKAKLKHKGIIDDTFNIEIRNVNKAKEKMIYVGNTFNPCSMISLKVYGKKETRKTIYNMGFGNSTGCGFGSIKVYEE
jgi:CRISPR-associated endoribonuclease Cas6